MTDKLEPGMYVRTEYGIGRIVDFYKEYIELDKPIFIRNIEDWENYCTVLQIIGKPSYKIIDLIRPGDYVNGYKVIECFADWLDLGSETAEANEIKTILTKEQFESLMYKVGDKSES